MSSCTEKGDNTGKKENKRLFNFDMFKWGKLRSQFQEWPCEQSVYVVLEKQMNIRDNAH